MLVYEPSSHVDIWFVSVSRRMDHLDLRASKSKLWEAFRYTLQPRNILGARGCRADRIHRISSLVYFVD